MDDGVVLQVLLMQADSRLAHGQRIVELRAYSHERGARSFWADLPRLQQSDASEIDRLRVWLEAVQAQRCNVAYVVNAAKDSVAGEHVGAHNITGVLGAWLDLDLFEEDLVRCKEIAQALIERAPLAPSLVVLSGKGLHLFWWFKRMRWCDLDHRRRKRRFERLQRHLQNFNWGYPALLPADAKLAGDPPHIDASIGDLARLMRLPGTWNFNCSVPRRCEVLQATPKRYGLKEILRAFPSLRRPVAVDESQASNSEEGAPDRLELLAAKLHAMGKTPRWVDADKFTSCCPVHDDEKPSMVVSRSVSGAVLVYCHVCGRDAFKEVARSLDLPPIWFAAGFDHPNVQVIHAAGGLHLYVAAVAAIEGLSPRGKYVLIALAAKVNPIKTGQIFGAAETLAEELKMPLRTFFDTRVRLRGKGLLTWLRGNSHGVSNEYFLCRLPSPRGKTMRSPNEDVETTATHT